MPIPIYTQDHIHLRSSNPKAVADFYHRVFDARIIESMRPNGKPRFDLDVNGLQIFIAETEPGVETQQALAEPTIGLDHFGFRVDNLEEAVEELRRRGADIIDGPRTVPSGLKIAFVRAPDEVRIEIVERS
jgi:catechol 2,3-dioxygenase-like lactoylglutathione lyase family enzyme